MMKKINLLSVSVLALAIVLGGCSSTATQPQQQMVDQGGNMQNGFGDPSGNMQGGNGQGQGNRQFQRPDAMGEISVLDGNNVTIKVIQMPNFGQGQGGQRQRTWRAGSSPRPRPSGSPGPRQQRQRQFTGETKIIALDGIVIQKMSFGDNGPQMDQIQVKDLQIGDVLQVFNKADDQSKIDHVSVGGLGGGGGGFGGGRGGNGGGRGGNGGGDGGGDGGNWRGNND